MDKKKIVGGCAILSTIISAVLWFWYGSIPSFDQMGDKSFTDANSTFQNEVVNNEK